MLTRRTLLRTGAASVIAQAALGANSRVRAGCQTNAWDLDPSRFETLLAALTAIGDLGFAGFETHLRYLQPQMSRQEEARAAIAALELVFIGAHANLPRFDQLGEERAVDDVGRLAMSAKQFGARTLILNPAAGAPPLDPKFLDLAARRALDMGVVFTLHTGEKQAASLVDQTNPKLVYFMLDLDGGGEATEFFQNHPGRTYGIHLSATEGLHELAAAVRRAKWISWLIHEESQPGQGSRQAKEGAALSRAAIKKVFGV